MFNQSVSWQNMNILDPIRHLKISQQLIGLGLKSNFTVGCFCSVVATAHRWEVKPVTCYLEGPEAQFEEDLDVLHVFVGRLHQVDEHHVVDPEQRDQQEGRLRQTSGERTHTAESSEEKLYKLCADKF